ncbi:MAG: AI-2E family transporter, partial [Acidimicrobiia bacterium]
MWSAGAGWRLLVAAAALALVLVVAYQLRLIVVPTIAALALSTGLRPLVGWLKSKGWPALLATWVVLLGVVGALVGLIALLSAPLGNQFAALGPDLRQAVDNIESWLTTGPLNLSPQALDAYVATAIEQIQANASGIGLGLLTGAYLAVEIVAGILLTLVLLFFFVKDGDRMKEWAAGHLTEGRRPAARAVLDRIGKTLGAYLRGTALVGIVNGVVIGTGLALIGVPLVLLLAVITFFGAFFPLIGATVAGLLAALLALVSGGPIDALLVVALVVVVQQVEGDVLSPLVMGRALRLHPVVILLALTAGAIAAGLLGALLAVPLTGVTVAAVDEWRVQR